MWGKKRLLVTLIFSFFFSNGCSLNKIDKSTSFDIENINYYYFQNLYNDMVLLSTIKNKLTDNQIVEIKSILEFNHSQRKIIYKNFESLSYNILQETYGEEVTNLIKQTVEKTNRISDQLYELYINNVQPSKEFNIKLQGLIDEYDEMVFHSANITTNVNLSLINLLFYPKQNMEEHGIDKIKHYVEGTKLKVEEIEELINNST